MTILRREVVEKKRENPKEPGASEGPNGKMSRNAETPHKTEKMKERYPGDVFSLKIQTPKKPWVAGRGEALSDECGGGGITNSFTVRKCLTEEPAFVEGEVEKEPKKKKDSRSIVPRQP